MHLWLDSSLQNQWKCIEEGPSLTFEKAKAFAKLEEGPSQQIKTSHTTPIHKLDQQIPYKKVQENQDPILQEV